MPENTSQSSAASVERRIILVTGASRGIGREAAKALALSGHHVIAVARSQAALEALDDEVKVAGGSPLTLVPLDLKDGNALDQLGAAIFQRWGRLDGLVAAAGVLGVLGPLQTVPPSEVEQTLAVNFTANWRLIRSLDPLLRASDSGRAVFVTSGVARRPRGFWGIYAATKAALEAMVLAYAEETRNMPLNVTLFNPGPTRTAMRARAFPGEDPMTLPTAAEVAAAILPLLAPEWIQTATLEAFSRP
jgi:NAD(P)-dependent dehydrogenase (short-subunit alcohol dehydrogenase family)